MLGHSFTLQGKDNEDRGEVETVPELSSHIILVEVMIIQSANIIYVNKIFIRNSTTSTKIE